MGETLSADQRDVIRQAARSDKYASSPVPRDLLDQLAGNLRDFVFVPYSAQAKLSNLYGSGTDCVSLLAADWAEAYACGALRMHDERSVSFPTHEQLANGEAVEVSISKSYRPDGLPWVLSYAPIVEHLKLMRDCVASDCCATLVESATPEHASTAPEHASTAPLPPVLRDEFEAMKLSDDYQTGALPADLLAEMRAIDGAFTDFVHVSQRWMEKIIACAKSDIDVLELLDRDWRIALDTNTLRIYDEKIQFPISILREDGGTLVEVSIKRVVLDHFG